MKKIVFTIASLVLSSIMVHAQNAVKPVAAVTSTVTATNESKAEMTFEHEYHDFGTIEHGGNGTYEFKFKNTGTEPLIISDAKGSCGCTVPTYPKDIPIKPGETQVIKVTYDTKRVGSFTKTVTIHSNSKKNVDVLTIKGTVLAEVTEEVFPANGKGDNGATPFEKH
jgi:Protein of unknown function (DUF1573)